MRQAWVNPEYETISRTQNNLLTTRTSQRRKYIGEVNELQVEQRRLATGAAPLPDQCWLHLSRTAEKDMTTQTAGGTRNAPWPVTLRSSRDCRWGEWITSALFHFKNHAWGETLEQGTPNCSPGGAVLAAHCSVYVCLLLCVCTWMG